MLSNMCQKDLLRKEDLLIIIISVAIAAKVVKYLCV